MALLNEMADDCVFGRCTGNSAACEVVSARAVCLCVALGEEDYRCKEQILRGQLRQT